MISGVFFVLVSFVYLSQADGSEVARNRPDLPLQPGQGCVSITRLDSPQNAPEPPAGAVSPQSAAGSQDGQPPSMVAQHAHQQDLPAPAPVAGAGSDQVNSQPSTGSSNSAGGQPRENPAILNQGSREQQVPNNSDSGQSSRTGTPQNVSETTPTYSTTFSV